MHFNTRLQINYDSHQKSYLYVLSSQLRSITTSICINLLGQRLKWYCGYKRVTDQQLSGRTDCCNYTGGINFYFQLAGIYCSVLQIKRGTPQVTSMARSLLRTTCGNQWKVRLGGGTKKRTAILSNPKPHYRFTSNAQHRHVVVEC